MVADGGIGRLSLESPESAGAADVDRLCDEGFAMLEARAFNEALARLLRAGEPADAQAHDATCPEEAMALLLDIAKRSFAL
jgi:hypothetical protein